MEQLDFNILFCWLVGLDMDYWVCSAGTYCHNRDAVAIACAVISMVKNLDFYIVAEGGYRKSSRVSAYSGRLDWPRLSVQQASD